MTHNNTNDIRNALTFNRDNTSRDLYRIVYTNRFNETRCVEHITFDDAISRAMTLRKRAYIVHVERMFI
jgi:hypothetical protein